MDVFEEDARKIVQTIDIAQLKGKRVLITGANGLIGTSLVSAIHYANQANKLHCHVTGISLHAPNRTLKRFLPNKELVFKSIDLSKSVKIQGRFDYIFHAAGYGQPAKFIADPISLININVNMAIQLLEIARKSQGTFCYFSSAETYGEIPPRSGGVDETYEGSVTLTNPRAIYAEAKRMGEAITAMYSRSYGVRGKIFRISHLYGPGISINDTRVLGNFLKGALISKKIVLRDEGKAVKTFGYIADAVAMMMHVALHGKDMIYHIGGKDVISIKGLADEIARQTNSRVIVPPLRSSDAHIGVDPKFVGLSIQKVLREMKKFPLIPMAEGLRRTIAWNKQEFKREISL